MINIPIQKQKFSDWSKMQGQLCVTYKETTWNIKTQVIIKSIRKMYNMHILTRKNN